MPKVNPAPGGAALFRADMQQGRAMARQRAWNPARASFLRAWQIAPDRPDVLFYLAIVEGHLPGHQWQAIDWWRSFLAAQNNNGNADVTLAEKQIAADANSAHQQAMALLHQLDRLAAMLPQQSQRSQAREIVKADTAFVKTVWQWRKGPHSPAGKGLRATWTWGLTAESARLPGNPMWAAAPLATPQQNQRAWRVFHRQELSAMRWIRHFARAVRMVGESQIHRRFVMYWALHFYLRHISAYLTEKHYYRAWAMGQNILSLEPAAEDMYRAVYPRNQYSSSLYESVESDSSYARKAALALYLPMRVGVSFIQRYNRRARLKVLASHWNLAIHDYHRVIAIYATLADPNFPYDATTARRLMRCQSYEYTLLGRALLHLGRYRRAVTAYAQAMLTFSANSAAADGLRMVKQRQAEMSKLAELSLKIHTGNRSAAALASRAEIRFHLGEAARALADCCAALNLSAALCPPRLLRMTIEMRQAKYHQAIADATTLLALHCPQTPKVYLLRGRCRQKVSQWALAIADYRQALRDHSGRGLAPEDRFTAMAGQMECIAKLHQYRAATLVASAIISAHAPAAIYAKAVSVMKKAAWHDSKTALVDLGRLYAWGKICRPDYLRGWTGSVAGPPPTRPGGVPINDDIALKAFKKSAMEGSATAMASVGALYYEQARYHQALKWFQKAARHGSGDAMSVIGWLYTYGTGVPRDKAIALRWFLHAASVGSGRGMRAIGVFYQHGYVVPHDLNKAMTWYRRAARAGCRASFNDIGYCFARGLGVPRDPTRAVKWYRRAARAGNESGIYDLAVCYKQGDGVVKDIVKARELETSISAPNYVEACYRLGGSDTGQRRLYWLNKAADLGDTRAINELGAIYHGGLGVPRDDVMAMRFYYRAEQLGSTVAMRRIASAYIHAQGVPLDYHRAKIWYLRAAALGDASAQRWLGVMFAAGWGKAFDYAPNYPRAKRCWQIAASEGSKQAMYDISMLYRKGLGVKRNTFMADKWLAKTGWPSAVYALAMHYQDGRGTAENPAKAFALLKKAADASWPAAMNMLAVDYMSGCGTATDNVKALKWFHYAADSGSIDSMLWLGKAYEDGKIIPRDYHLAMAWYEKAAAKGSIGADDDIGVMYYLGEGTASNFHTALTYWKKGAAKGSKTCMGWIALCYRQGLGVAVDPFKATMWHARAGNASAQNQFGYDYYTGQGVQRNYHKAFYWFSRAAAHGNSVAMHNLGCCYLLGRGVVAWPHMAVQWLRSAAQKGDESAMLDIGEMYDQAKIMGVAIPDANIDVPKALDWYRKAAALGSKHAAVNIAVIYIKGHGVLEDDVTAVRWFRKAAREGSVNAMNWLAWCYQNGRGVAQDRTRAMKWRNKAQAMAGK